MMKQKDGFYYEKKVDWDNRGLFFVLLLSFIVCILLFINNVYFLINHTTILWGEDYMPITAIVMILQESFLVIAFSYLWFFLMDIYGNRKVKYRRIGK